MISSRNAHKIVKIARFSAHPHFTQKCPKCPIFRPFFQFFQFFPHHPRQKCPLLCPIKKFTKKFIPFFAPNMVKFYIFVGRPDNLENARLSAHCPTSFFSANRPLKMPEMGISARIWSPWLFSAFQFEDATIIIDITQPLRPFFSISDILENVECLGSNNFISKLTAVIPKRA